ncbi:MAG: glycosyltransferase family 2 protein [Thermodesulfobacteria bacterium]|nr:glycosyltransferase family 2 protein [Thermodesulfobacteriota bacterium]
MKKLRFQIRTWNRAEKLKVCLERIIEEIEKVNAQEDCIIFVIDNHSSDATPQLLKSLQKKYSFLKVYRNPEWYPMGKQPPLPKEVLSEIDAEFAWSLGDDDIIIKDAFAIVWKFLNTEHLEDTTIIHVANAQLQPHSYKIYKGTVLEFMNLMGFNQFIGWAASQIQHIKVTRKILFEDWGEDYMEEFYKKRQPLYQTTAFPHVLMALHFFADTQAVVLDYPIVTPMETKETKEHIERWEKENIGWRYFLFVKVLKQMFDEGLLREKLKPTFFKYLNHNLWDRFLREMIAARIGRYFMNPRPDEGWDIILMIAKLIDDPTTSRLIRTSVFTARSACELYQTIKEKLEKEKDEALEEKRKEVFNQLASVIDELGTPIFEAGWAGKGFKGEVLK